MSATQTYTSAADAIRAEIKQYQERINALESALELLSDEPVETDEVEETPRKRGRGRPRRENVVKREETTERRNSRASRARRNGGKKSSADTIREMIDQGMRNKDIADKLEVSPSYVSVIRGKM